MDALANVRAGTGKSLVAVEFMTSSTADTVTATATTCLEAARVLCGSGVVCCFGSGKVMAAMELSEKLSQQ